MSEKLKEIAKANSKGDFVGTINDEKIIMGFTDPKLPDYYVGFRFLWRIDEGLLFKGFLNYSEPTTEVGLWICHNDHV